VTTGCPAERVLSTHTTRYRFNPACQFTITVEDGVSPPSDATVRTRNRFPSAATSKVRALDCGMLNNACGVLASNRGEVLIFTAIKLSPDVK
jgi:hypothetical protein